MGTGENLLNTLIKGLKIGLVAHYCYYYYCHTTLFYIYHTVLLFIYIKTHISIVLLVLLCLLLSYSSPDVFLP